MAPSSKYALATVYSTQVKSSDESSIVVEAGGFTPTRWFLEHSSGQGTKEEEPKKKRRKIQHIFEDEHQDNPDAALVPLFKVAIDFHFPNHTSPDTLSQDAISEDVDFTNMPRLPVVPYGIDTNDSGTRVRFFQPHSGDSVLIIECAELSQDVTDALLNIAPPGRLRKAAASARQKNHPATMLTCTLTRSAGPLHTVVRLEASLSWRSELSAFPAGAPVGAAKIYEDYELLLAAFPDDEREGFDHTQPFDPQDFYESVHVPPKDASTDAIIPGLLESELYPVQKRAVAWMLHREGATIAGDHVPESTRAATIDRFYKAVVDLNGESCWVNHLQGIITRTPPHNIKALSGGILAEEMGLGKTVELMALLYHNVRPQITAQTVLDMDSGTIVMPSRATLIVTPPSLTSQWKSELLRHAPSLKVYQYEGIPASHKKALPEEETIRLLCEDYDVVITTYNVLGREIHFAEDPPDRSRRQSRKFERKRSPLVQIQWWRLCLDEAQLVESGVTAAARVACRLPRVHSWAVSGTPLRKDVQDLLGLLIFLRYRPFSDDGKVWAHLLTNHRHLCRGIFSKIALRHTKAQVRDELRLPEQKRMVITVPFSVVEQQNYTTLFNQMCDEAGLNQHGVPSFDDWDPDDPNTVETMRSWLVRLRQTCLHPQVGARNRRGLGRAKAPLRTVAEVLEVMIEQNETALRTEERALTHATLQRAHVLGNNREDEHRAEKAVEVYRSAMRASEQMVMEARKNLAAFKVTDAEAVNSDTDGEDSATESTSPIGALKNNLRSALQLQHECAFFAATAYYQIKTNETLTLEGSDTFKQLEAQEMALYESAKATRKELLKDVHRKAESLIFRVAALKSEDSLFTRIKDLSSYGGIESRRFVEKSDSLFDVIREAVPMLKEWRAKITEFLLKPLVDEDDGLETTGDEYENSTKLQDELYVYMDALKGIHADLHFFVTGETAPLIDHEINTQLKHARFNLNPKNVETQEFADVVGREEIIVKLFGAREKVRSLQDEVGSVRGLVQEARTLESSIEWNASGRVEAELAIVRQHMAGLQAVHAAYGKTLWAVEKEVELFRTTHNQRLEYYRQLQELSDDVSPYKDELDDQLDNHALGVAMQREEEASSSVAQLQTKSRFLLSLREDNNSQSGPRTCIICTADFERGVLTVCGHQYCKDCLTHWMSQRRNCPMCKRRLDSKDIHDITFKAREMRAQEEIQSGESSNSQSTGDTPDASRDSIYSDVDRKVLEQIRDVDLPASYGTKIDTIGRHLHWIRDNDPGAKSIVFSQYREFLDVLGTALKDFKIGYARLGRSGAIEKFRHDPSVDCLLLDAKTDSSGLTLVNATHVFICEPLIQTAVELQAIARVHRIGQTRATTVWMYLINDTVEEAIYDISVARRLAHVESRQQQSRRAQKSRSTTPAPQLGEYAIDAANSAELQSAALSKLLGSGKGAGELVKNEDLWQCLFGKANARSDVAEKTVSRHLRATAAEERAELEQ